MLNIKSRFYDYQVEFHPQISGFLGNTLSNSKNFYLVDQKVAELYDLEFRRHGNLWTTAQSEQRVLLITATEEQKSYEKLTPIIQWLLENKFRKDNTLVVVGGGIVQDIGAFISAVLFRGAKWELIPTTLLAQADSCIGAKSSINIGRYKNQVGTFYPPRKVLLSAEFVRTLTWDEIRSGIGEIVKLGWISSEEDHSEIMSKLSVVTGPEFMNRSPAEISDLFSALVSNALNIKKRYIEADELDQGIRNFLNYGHTFGHAYESVTHFGIPHGIAVILGMCTATFVSEKIGLCKAGEFETLWKYCYKLVSPYHQKLADHSATSIVQAMMLDKKNSDGKINCILTQGIGKVERRAVEFPLEPEINRFIQTVVSRK